MGRDARVSLAWGDGERAFRLGIGELRELQEKTDAGPAWIFERLRAGTWRVDDIRETLRLGLIGGGAPPAEAAALVARYVDVRPLMENRQPAMAVLLAALVGAEDEPIPKPAAAEAPTSGAESSPSPPSTGPEP